MNRRPLQSLLTELMGSMVETPTPVVAHSIELSLPVDVRFGPVVGPAGDASGADLSADVPLWRWRTDFDPVASRLKLRIVAEAQ